jgi:hypothetical protein
VQEGRRWEGNKREGRVVGKTAGDKCVFMLVKDRAGRRGWVRQAVRGGHRAAEPHGVIHRYLFNKVKHRRGSLPVVGTGGDAEDARRYHVSRLHIPVCSMTLVGCLYGRQERASFSETTYLCKVESDNVGGMTVGIWIGMR